MRTELAISGIASRGAKYIQRLPRFLNGFITPYIP
jgi:hypothetical protein